MMHSHTTTRATVAMFVSTTMDAMTLSRAVRAVRSRVGASRASERARGTAGFVVPARSTRGTRAREGRARALDGDVVAMIASANGGLETARAALGAATVALIMFQGPKGDGVVNSLNEGRVFGSAAKAKSAVDYATYALIGGFIAMSVVLAASG